ncbi:helix-turn-helix domain-containing protein [Streptomyces sp. NPDC002851]
MNKQQERAERRTECERLAGTLRELRSGTGLSLAALAAKTPYSKSSWERYLNGKALPPRQAVEELCTLAGERADRPLALWELAEAAWSGRAGAGAGRGPAVAPASAVAPAAAVAPASAGDPEPRPERAPEAAVAVAGAARRRRRLRSGGFAVGVLGGLAAVAAAVLLAVWGFDGSGQSVEGDTGARGRTGEPGPSCQGDACTGKSPEQTRCSTAANQPSTVAERRFGGDTVVKVRHSAACGTVWARIDRGQVGDRVSVTAPGIAAQHTEVRDRWDAEASLSTPMTAAERPALAEVEVCVVRDGERSCFSGWDPD